MFDPERLINRDSLINGIIDASIAYDRALGRLGLNSASFLDIDYSNDKKPLHVLNPDVYVPDAIDLTEDVDLILGDDKIVEKVEDDSSRVSAEGLIGQAVAESMLTVIHDLRVLRSLPRSTSLVIEVNTNRGFSDRQEIADPGCLGLPEDVMPGVIVDMNYWGESKLKYGLRYPVDSPSAEPLPVERIHYSRATSLERDMARLRIRPAYVNDNVDHVPADDSGITRVVNGASGAVYSATPQSHISRAVALVHNVSEDYSPSLGKFNHPAGGSPR